MQYSLLGNSGLVVSRIALGCMSFGSRKWRPWMLEEEEAMPFFRRAVELGINFFDTADVYSLGVSEEITGKAVREYANRDEAVVATKVRMRMGTGPNRGGLSAKHIVQSCEASLKRLGLERIDLYQIHRADASTPVEETLAALDRLVQDGKVLYIGASSMFAWELMKMLSVSERNGWARFISMQNHYNLVYREEEREMMPLCADQGIGAIPWSPLARGLLTGKRSRAGGGAGGGGARGGQGGSADGGAGAVNAGPGSPAERGETDTLTDELYDHDSDWDVVDAALRVARRRGVEPVQVALAWLLSRPAVVAPVVGFTKVGQMDAAAASVDLVLGDDECAELEAPYRPHAVRGWLGGAVRLPGISS
ncbi:MAG: aldo/keto reductase [Gemmatimonadota bacterium]|nr:aldo/keto reductase [Gemmatimonadota bacterium]